MTRHVALLASIALVFSACGDTSEQSAPTPSIVAAQVAPTTTTSTAPAVDFEAAAEGHIGYVANEVLGPLGSQRRSKFSSAVDGRTGQFAFSAAQETAYATLSVSLMEYFQFSAIDVERLRGTRGIDGVMTASSPLASMSWSYASGDESRVTIEVTANITTDVPG